MKKLIFLVYTFFLSSQTLANINVAFSDSVHVRFNQAIQNINLSPVESEKLLSDFHTYFVQQQDTVNIILSKISLALCNKFMGKYTPTFDHLWSALQIAERNKNKKLQMQVHEELIHIYHSFGRLEDKLYHLSKVLSITKELYGQGLLENNAMVSVYLMYAGHFRNINNLDQARRYLDSCDRYVEPKNGNAFVLTEKSQIYAAKNQLKKADSLLTHVTQYFTKNNHDYIVISSFFKGNLKFRLNQSDSAIYYYSKSIQAAERSNKHLNTHIAAMNKLSETLLERGDIRQAYNYLLQSKMKSDEIYSWKDSDNQVLFELKNQYRDAIEDNKIKLALQELEIAKQEKANLRLKVYFTGIFVLIISGLVFYRMHSKRKAIAQKKEQELRIEQDKHSIIVQVKNKELTSFTLQLIDKENEIAALEEYINVQLLEKHSKKKSIRIAPGAGLWEEFNKRFTQVNTDFYQRLREKFPNLTPTEEKHCALIKLNFSSKEMAHLLRISPASVDLSRHNIRKKMKLNREDNLTKFISEI